MRRESAGGVQRDVQGSTQADEPLFCREMLGYGGCISTLVRSWASLTLSAKELENELPALAMNCVKTDRVQITLCKTAGETLGDILTWRHTGHILVKYWWNTGQRRKRGSRQTRKQAETNCQVHLQSIEFTSGAGPGSLYSRATTGSGWGGLGRAGLDTFARPLARRK